MLELKHISKIYTSKAGETRALDDVSVVFPEKGMVFVLGKSGCGKSTLLNVCGGLDVPDEGELSVKGRSTKDFTETDYDSYRNTCVGFVFQEYNILSEFSVEDNIAIALELQGKPKDSAAIADILKQVDLESVATRKPDTLSGGQKQRVAIARALVKNPEIIMADEPTGALDSVTGKQVFDILKKLSLNKLVIVVSHDREFAELYADRIIELKDGRIISDAVKDTEKSAESTEKLTFVGDDTVLVKKGSTLEKEDLNKLNAFFSSSDCDVLVCKNGDEIEKYKKIFNISTGGERIVFRERESAPEVRIYRDEDRKLIRSRLPLHRAIKIGASGMKIKPFRFAITLLLAIVSFTMFGLFSTVMFYDPVTVAGNTLSDTGDNFLLLNKQMNVRSTIYENGKKDEEFDVFYGIDYTDEDIAALKQTYGNGVIPVYSAGLTTATNYKTSDDNAFMIYNFVPAEQVNVVYVYGKAPETDAELAISDFAFGLLRSYGYNSVTSFEDVTLVTSKGTFTLSGVYETPYSDEGLVVNDTLPYGNSTYGDNFLLSALVTRGFYEKNLQNDVHKQADSVCSHVYGIYASPDTDSYVTSGSTSLQLLYKSATLRSLKAVDLSGETTSETGDGAGISFALWVKLFAPDLAAAADAKGVGDLFYETADENGFTLKQKYDSLCDNAIYDKNKELIGDPLELLSDIVSFAYGYGLVESDDLAFYDYDKNVMTTTKVTAICSYGSALYQDCVYANDDLYKTLRDYSATFGSHFQEITTDFDFIEGDYGGVYVPVAGDRALITELVRGEDDVSSSTSYRIVNSNYLAVKSLSESVSLMSDIFLLAGLGLALFSALLLFNFISASIADKKREIGILRAVGAKSSDVFKIFLSESMIIAGICAVASLIITAVVCVAINVSISSSLGTTLSLFSFGVLTVVIVLGVALATAILSTVIPVYAFSKKKPADTIRNL